VFQPALQLLPPCACRHAGRLSATKHARHSSFIQRLKKIVGRLG